MYFNLNFLATTLITQLAYFILNVFVTTRGHAVWAWLSRTCRDVVQISGSAGDLCQAARALGKRVFCRCLRWVVVCSGRGEKGGELLVDDSQAFLAHLLPVAVTGALGKTFDRIHFTHMEEPIEGSDCLGDPSAEIAVAQPC